jgi:hypothetical protein
MQKFRILNMRILRMLNRAAFICNICFLLTIGILYFKGLFSGELQSTVVIMGVVLSLILNIVVVVWLFILKITRKSIVEVSKPIVFINTAFLAIQLFLLSSI